MQSRILVALVASPLFGFSGTAHAADLEQDWSDWKDLDDSDPWGERRLSDDKGPSKGPADDEGPADDAPAPAPPLVLTLEKPAEVDTFKASFKLEADYDALMKDMNLVKQLTDAVCDEFISTLKAKDTPACKAEATKGSVNVILTITAPEGKQLPEDLPAPTPEAIVKVVKAVPNIDSVKKDGKEFAASPVETALFKEGKTSGTQLQAVPTEAPDGSTTTTSTEAPDNSTSTTTSLDFGEWEDFFNCTNDSNSSNSSERRLRWRRLSNDSNDSNDTDPCKTAGAYLPSLGFLGMSFVIFAAIN